MRVSQSFSKKEANVLCSILNDIHSGTLAMGPRDSPEFLSLLRKSNKMYERSKMAPMKRKGE